MIMMKTMLMMTKKTSAVRIVTMKEWKQLQKTLVSRGLTGLFEEMARKREQERQRQEKLAETSRYGHHRRRSRSRSRSYSRTPPSSNSEHFNFLGSRYRHSRNRSRSWSRSPRRRYSQSRSPR